MIPLGIQIIMSSLTRNSNLWVVPAMLLPGLVMTASRPWTTERELLADGASGFLAAQEISARLFDIRMPPIGRSGKVSMGQLHEEIVAKFLAPWEELEGHGRKWRWTVCDA